MTETELKNLQSRREHVFRSIQILYDISKQLENDDSKLKLFRARYKHIDRNRDEFIELTQEINSLKLTINPKDKVDFKQLESMEEIYYEIVSVADDLAPAGGDCGASSGLPAPPPSIHTDPSMAQYSPRLPQLQLPKFDSEIENWPTFHDTFVKLVHENNSISNIEKFHYLISCLSGSALSIVKGVPITDLNYHVAFDALVDRYQNKRLLAATYIDRVFNIPQLKSSNVNELSKLTNTLLESINALKAIQIPQLGDYILFHLVFRALDFDTRRRFEIQNSSHIPTFEELLQFLQNHIKVLEISNFKVSNFLPTPSRSSFNNRPNSKKKYQNNYTSSNHVAQNIQLPTNCICCDLVHTIYKCNKFLSFSLAERQNFVEQNKLCCNCLRKHDIGRCTSKTGCFKCGERHHTLLHQTSTEVNGIHHRVSTTAHVGDSRSLVLLGTCVVQVHAANGAVHNVRALIDSGAQDCFMTAVCAQRLGLPLRRCDITVSGLGKNSVHQVKGITTCEVQSRHSDEAKFRISPIVLKSITTHLPVTEIPAKVRQYYRHLVLADDDFDKPADIELLLGAELFHDIYDGQRLVPSPGLPAAIHSVFGWVLTGKVSQDARPQQHATSLVSSTIARKEVVKRFREVEELPSTALTSPEEQKPNFVLASSFQNGLKHVLNPKRRIRRPPQADYVDFIHNYQSLGHMQPVDSVALNNNSVISPHCITTSPRNSVSYSKRVRKWQHVYGSTVARCPY